MRATQKLKQSWGLGLSDNGCPNAIPLLLSKINFTFNINNW